MKHLFFQTLQEASQFSRETTHSTQNQMVNLYKISRVRRTVYLCVPTRGTEKDTHPFTLQETTCLLRNPSITQVHTNFDVMHLMVSDQTVTCTVDG